MMPLYSISFLLLVACAILFYRAGEFEGSSGILWAAVSVLISVVVWRWLRWGWAGIIVAQVPLFFAIGVYRASRKDGG